MCAQGQIVVCGITRPLEELSLSHLGFAWTSVNAGAHSAPVVIKVAGAVSSWFPIRSGLDGNSISSRASHILIAAQLSGDLSPKDARMS